MARLTNAKRTDAGRLRWKRRVWLMAGFLPLFSLFLAQADEVTGNEEVIERYEQILEREPVEGPSLDKLLQIYQEGEGLEKLDARWAPWSARPGAKGATYSLLRGLLADRMARTDDARKLLQAATQAQPGDFHGWMALGDFEVRQGRWVDAIAALQKGLATNVTGDDRLALYRKLGQAQERNLDLSAALATWQKMVQEFPKDPFAVEEAGTAELDAEQFDEAKKTFQQLVDLTEPNSMNRVQALMRLAEVDDRQGKTEAAVHDYEAILPLTAESSWLNRELRAQIEQVYRREDDLAGLADYYRKWTQDNPKDVEALLLLAGTLNELGKKNDALDVLRKVTVLAPDRHEVRQSFAQALVEAKQYDEAITVLTALTADDPTEPRYWETMGDALWLKTQPPTPDTRKATLDAWAHIDPPDSTDVAAVLEVADLCRDHGLNDEALAGYQRALKLSPDASDIREKAAKLLVDMKRPDDAWKLLDQMAEGNLATADNDLKLATLDGQFGRKDAASAAIQKGLSLDPKSFDLLSAQWSWFADAQKWSDCIALFDQLIAAAPNADVIDQLEARHLQALTSGGRLDDTGRRLKAKLGADPGLSEGELRLLLRIMIQQSDTDLPKALDEARRRFPQSVSLTRIEIDTDRHQGDYDGAVAALQRLVQTMPEQKTEWLSEIVHVRQDQGNFDEALAAAQQIIDASPTGADGYLLYAEIAFNAGKPDDAVTKLQAAIKLSDKPNDVRQRLARYYLEAGQAGKARTIYDDAFAAAESPQDKLMIVRAMTAAYFQDGQIEELINRFKKEQNSEEGGWRYGLYLSAIDEQMEDYGAARRELAKSLSVRPQDTGLLHSLIGLADKEGDMGELLRYREMLAAADPSATNELALANEYASQGKSEEAWHIVQKNLGEVVKDPLAWKDVLNDISDPEYAAKIQAVLEEAIRSKGGSFEGEFALAQFQMEQGDLDSAKGTLWEILAQRLPPAPPVPAASQNASPLAAMFGYGMYQSPLFQRASQSYVAMSEAQQLLSSAQTRGQMRQQMMMMRSMYSRMGVSTTLDPVAIKDHSLVYLSVIAVQQKQAAEFLKELQEKFDTWHWSLAERLVAYSLIQAREPLLETIEEQAKSAAPDKDLDGYCFMLCEEFTAQGQNTDEATSKRAEAAQTLLSSRLGKDPQFRNMAALIQISQLAGDVSPEAMAKKKAAVDDYLKTIDRKNAGELLGAIGICAQVDDWDGVRKAADDLAATDRAKWSLVITQQLGYLPMSIMQQASAAKGAPDKQIIPALLEILRLGYPATPPRPALSGTGPNSIFGINSFNQNTFPPANRYFGADRVGMLEPMFQQLKSRAMLPDMYAALDQEEKDLGDWRAIYPELLRIYFQWWDGKRDDASASVRKLLEQNPSDDFRLLLASMLTQQQKYDDAIPVLESVSARYGPDYIETQKELLHTARLAKNNDVGQKAALRLLALRLPQQEEMQILDDLRNVGLKDKADQIVAQQTGRGPGAGINQAIQAGNQLIQTLNGAMSRNDETVAIDVAHQILNRDPLASSPYGNDNYLRTEALNALKRFGQLDAYTQDVLKQLQAAPDSVRLNWLAAEAYQSMDARLEHTLGMAPLPQWLKLQRTGKTIEGLYSLDGKTWISAGKADLDLPEKICLGFLVSTQRGGPHVQVSVDQVAFTGRMTTAGAADSPTTSSGSGPSGAGPASTNLAVSPANPAETNLTSATPASAQPPAPWQQSDIGDVTQPGAVTVGPDQALALTGAIGGRGPEGEGIHLVYQMLDGDGSVTARFDHLVTPAIGRNETAGIMIRDSVGIAGNGATVVLNPARGIAWRYRARTPSGSPPASTVTAAGPSSNIVATPTPPAVPPAAPALTLSLSPSNGPMRRSRTFVPAERRESSGWSGRSVGELATPLWLKLARKGNTFTGSISSDGKTWNAVFSHDVAMGPDARVGLMSAVDGSQASEAAWTDVKISSASDAAVSAPAPTTVPAASISPATGETPPASPTLAAPWEFMDIGNPTQSGRAQGSASDLTLTSSVPILSNESRSYSFAYQTLHGDGEIVAHLKSQAESGYRSRDGICFRSRLDSNAPEIELYRIHADQIGYYLNTDTAEQALIYYQRVAQLDPKNQRVLATIAEQLRRAKKSGEAADLYASILKADFVAGMNQYSNAMQAFEEANRLPEFVKIIEAWSPPPVSPLGGQGQDMYFVLVQVANQLRENGHLPEAEQVYRKALSVDTFQSKQDGVASLVQVLIDENRRDEAASEVEKWLLDAGSPSSAPPPPILGFNYQIQSQNNWFQSLGWNQNGVVVAPIVHFFELADDLGLSSKLRQELKAQADKKGPAPGGQIDQNRVASILLTIIARDPGYRTELEKLLKDYPAPPLGMGANSNAFIILSQQLEKWPEERAMALRLTRLVYDGVNAMPGNSFFQNIAAQQLVRVALASGNHKTAQEALHRLIDNIREQRAMNQNQIQLEVELTVMNWLIQESMLKEASDLLADIKTDPQLASGNTYYQQKVDQVEKDLAFAQGQNGPVALVYGLAETPEKSSGKSTGVEIFWQINAGKKETNNEPYFSTGSWVVGEAVRPTTYRIEVNGGPDEQHLTTHLASYSNVATQGHAPLGISGTSEIRVVQAALIQTKPDVPPGSSPAPGPAHASSTSPLAPEAVATGQLLLLDGPENLLKNPTFQAVKDASGKSELAGWSGVLSAGISQESGGPLPKGGYQSIEANNGMYGGSEITSDRIALLPNTTYVFGGWMRLVGSFGFRYLDASGKTLNPNQFVSGSNDGAWEWHSWLLKNDPREVRRGETIPAQAAFLEIVFRPSQDCDFAGLSLRVLRAPEKTPLPAATEGGPTAASGKNPGN